MTSLNQIRRQIANAEEHIRRIRAGEERARAAGVAKPQQVEMALAMEYAERAAKNHSLGFKTKPSIRELECLRVVYAYAIVADPSITAVFDRVLKAEGIAL